MSEVTGACLINGLHPRIKNETSNEQGYWRFSPDEALIDRIRLFVALFVDGLSAMEQRLPSALIARGAFPVLMVLIGLLGEP
jgi:hypothetical protein